jgi:periplasmic divalent cation tolerance protein
MLYEQFIYNQRRKRENYDTGGKAMQPVVVTTSCGSFEEAEKIARQILDERLAACVQITPAQSLYWWKEKIESEKEYIVNMKSKRAFFNKLIVIIKKYHSYDVPEIIATDIVAMEQSYQTWLTSELADL